MQWLHEMAAPVALLSPQTINSTAKFSNIVDMSRFHEVMFVFLLGDMASETIDLGVQEATAEGGPFAALAGKQATQLAANATANDAKIVVITVKSEELSVGHRHLRARAVTGGATGGVAAIVALGRSRYRPSTDDDSSAVIQIIA
jgi:hypothetical protein